MKKNILKVILFFSILLVFLIILSFITMPKNNNLEAGIYNLKANGILGEPEDTIDVIVVGDSESFASIIPMQLWDEYGITSYICGSPAQILPETYSFVYNAMKIQNPKVVILEANNIFRDTTIDDGIDKILHNILPVTEYHSRWKHIKKEDFYKKPEYTWTDELKGYDYTLATDPADSSNYMSYSEEKTEIKDINIMYIELLNKLCKDNNCEFIIVSTPSTLNWSYEDHNATKELAEKENIEFLDFNMLKDEININWETDTRDKGDHLNQLGAVKVTKYLGKYLNDKNILTNHKNDERFSKWNENLSKYKDMIK